MKNKKLGGSGHINYPDQQTVGTHMNISGVVIAKYAPNKDNAVKLVELLSGDKAQHLYAEL